MVRIDVTEITREEALAENGTGEWGVKLGNHDVLAWECPMLGGGGASGAVSGLTDLLACYHDTDSLDAEDGPDEILYKSNDGRFMLLTISVE